MQQIKVFLKLYLNFSDKILTFNLENSTLISLAINYSFLGYYNSFVVNS